MQPHSPSLGVVAREMALDIAEAVYDPQVATHVPGVANTAADELSRRLEPNHAFKLPPILHDASEVHPPERTDKWWRTGAARQSQTGHKGPSPVPIDRPATATSSSASSSRAPPCST